MRHTDRHGRVRTAATDADNVHESPRVFVFAADGAPSLLNLCVYLLDRSMNAQAGVFENEGGFMERLYRR